MSDNFDEMAVISELVLGYREGAFGDIVKGISNMKIKSINYEKNRNVELLFEACDEIAEIVESIRADYSDELEQGE